MAGLLSSGAASIDAFLGRAGSDRMPWLAVCFAGGIAAWFLLANPLQWLAFLGAMVALSLAGLGLRARSDDWPFLRQALIAAGLAAAAGCAVVWAKSELAGTRPIARPVVATVTASVLDREPQPAHRRVRLILALREPGGDRAIRARVNLPESLDHPALEQGALVRLKVRLMPPAPPMLPGGYDFARRAWFSGLAASGSALGPVAVLRAGDGQKPFRRLQERLSRHVRQAVPGDAGAIAATLASGDRGALSPGADQAMRDSGLAHLLSISGLHVTAVVGAAYLLTLRLLALWSWLALRLRLPLAAALAGAVAGIGYTLLTGAEVPTIRSCIGALLVLAAVALGREALSMRMLALAALFVLVLWPEAVIGPSFQMSFAAVIALIALHGAEPVRRFAARRDEAVIMRGLRAMALLLLTGLVIELALMPISLFHFHRSGAYGALANLVAIPLTTFVSMPLIALALLLDGVGLGAPVWWLAGGAIRFMLWLAHRVAEQPGAVTLVPEVAGGSVALLVAGGLWLGLWRGHARLPGLIPALIGAVWIAQARPPDLLVSGDGRHVAIVNQVPGSLLLLRATRSSFALEMLGEAAGLEAAGVPLDRWPGARCSRDFCVATVEREGTVRHLLIARSDDLVEERGLAAACERADIVIAPRRLPGSCRPAWLKADRALLNRTGGLAIDLRRGTIRTVAMTQGRHGWWRPRPAGRAPRRAPADQ